jgi:hypothetical protein
VVVEDDGTKTIMTPTGFLSPFPSSQGANKTAVLQQDRTGQDEMAGWQAKGHGYSCNNYY